MARLNLKASAGNTTTTVIAVDNDSDNDELPDLCTLLQRLSHTENGATSLGARKPETETSPRRKQRPLRLAHVNSLLLLPVRRHERATSGGDNDDDLGNNANKTRPKLGETAVVEGTKKQMKKEILSQISFSDSSTSSSPSPAERAGNTTDNSSDGLSGFIVDDSASELDEIKVPRIRIPNEWKRTSPWKDGKAGAGSTSSIPNGSHKNLKASPKKSISGHPVGGAGRFRNEPGAGLKVSPPQWDRMLHTITSRENLLITPPSSPSKPKLQSPSKRLRIPPSPHRPSVDAFWSNEVVNEWNDKHSPTKEIKITREPSVCSISDDDDDFKSYSSFPTQALPLSPSKKNQPEIQRRKMFNAKKHELATSFLHQLDQTITNNQINALALSAGGVKIVWSNKLQSTAGRAHWKEEPIFSESLDGARVRTGCRHHAKIELAEKVIDNEDRLFNVLAHEFCHLATFMISKVKHRPHGKEFKSWAHKVTTSFSHLSIHVTTKHSYDITYKYIWACTSPQCSHHHKRHSKSIDPKRHACGKCRSPLVQIKPTPRATNKDAEGEGKEGAGGSSGRTAWQDYVKANLGSVREEKPGMGMKVWMEELGKRFREEGRGRGTGKNGEKGEKGEVLLLGTSRNELDKG